VLGRSLLIVATAALCLAAGSSAGGSVAALSDEFDDATLAGWQQMQGDATVDPARVSAAGGVLTIHSAHASWVREQRAYYIWKDVAGDFSVTTRVKVTGESAETPTADWSLAGLLVRRPDTDRSHESWIGWTTGGVSSKQVFERKTTTRSTSILELQPARTGWLELRVVRLGAVFLLLHRYPDGGWLYDGQYRRPDLPKTVEVGIDAQSGWGVDFADLVAHVDYVRFAETGLPRALRAKLQHTYVVSRSVLRYVTR
jgi:hypothetical protein